MSVVAMDLISVLKHLLHLHSEEWLRSLNFGFHRNGINSKEFQCESLSENLPYERRVVRFTHSS